MFVLDDKLRRIIALFIKRCSNSHLSREFERCLEEDDWDSLVKLSPNPTKYDCYAAYTADSDLCGLLKKVDNLPTSFDKTEVALEKWFDAEQSCYWTNERIAQRDTWDPRIIEFMQAVRRRISKILGPVPEHLMLKHGPGSTFADTGGATPLDKMSSVPTLTRDAWPWLVPLFGTKWGSCIANIGELSFVHGNRHATVPKNSRTERSIGIEPSVNVAYQLAAGRHIRARLQNKKICGVDLDNGQAYHREMAALGSFTGSLATIDLSSASDTVSRDLVRFLLPPAWVELLDSLRSPFTLVGERWIRLEKYSSMGNGFTFELETLIFFCLSSEAFVRALGYEPEVYSDIAVYGDDIIVRTKSAQAVLAILSFCGFTTNVEKTFLEGPFRESCGGDFFDGVDCRPYSLKKIPTEPQDWIGFANGVRRLAARTGGFDGEPELFKVWRLILDELPYGIRQCRGPCDLGDIVIHDRRENWSTRTKDSIRYVRCYVPISECDVALDGFGYDVLFASLLYGISVSDDCLKFRGRENSGRGVISRRSKQSFVVKWVPYS